MDDHQTEESIMDDVIGFISLALLLALIALIVKGVALWIV